LLVSSKALEAVTRAMAAGVYGAACLISDRPKPDEYQLEDPHEHKLVYLDASRHAE